MLKKLFIPILLFLLLFTACSENTDLQIEQMLQTVIESIDWDELKGYAEKGYDALTEKFPALKAENVKAFVKNNGLNLMNRYVESTDPETRENAKKLGEIIKILNPDLTDEIDAILGK